MAATVNVGPVATVIVVESADFATHGVAAMADALSQLVTTHAPSCCANCFPCNG